MRPPTASAFHRLRQAFAGDRLQQEVERLAFKGVERVLIERRLEHDERARFGQPARDVETGDLRHLDVEQDHIRPKSSGGVERGQAGRIAERAGVTRVTAEMAARLETALGRGATSRPPRRLLVRHHAGHRLLPVAEIDRFVADDGVYAVVGSSRQMVDDSLDDLERRLATSFVRTSRADLIAIDRVDHIASNGDGSATLTLRDGSAWRVSQRRATAVTRALER